MKLCRKCNQVKSLDDFHKDKSRKDKHCRICKSCNSDYERKRERKYIKKHELDRAVIYRKKMSDNYIITQLKNRGFCKEQITPQLIQIQRLSITLKRNINELQQNNRPISGCQ